MSEWSFDNKAVEENERMPAAKQIGSKGILIGFGPPKYKSGAKIVLCGFIQNMNLNQQKQIQEIFEIGSGDRFFSDGPTRNMLSIARALFSGASILKMMGTGLTGRGMDGSDPNLEKVFRKKDREAAASDFDDAHWINLSSSFFNNPLGVYLDYGSFDGEGERKSYSKTYLENCKIQALSTNLQAGQWLTQEQVQIMFANPVPIDSVSMDDYYEQRNDLINDINDLSESTETDFDYQDKEID